MSAQREARNIVILGSTGSIGQSTLEVVRRSGGFLKIRGLSAKRNSELLSEQARKFEADQTVLADGSPESEKSLCDLVQRPDVDIVVVAIVGFAALKPTLAAIEKGKTIALANKEVLVTSGALIMRKARESGATIIPVDSEHNSIFQAMQGHSLENIRRIILTASGGPFRGKKKSELENVTVSEALNHPKWKMGPKITIDSATLMNKGLEVIEACHLFGVTPDMIDVVVHPQSLVHGIIEFVDGTYLAHIAPPDMKAAISYALYYPERQAGAVKKMSLVDIGTLTFEPVDHETFPCLELARQAFGAGGLMPAALNAANEELVQAFLDGKIKFNAIPEIIHQILAKTPQQDASLENIFEIDRLSRKWTREKLNFRVN